VDKGTVVTTHKYCEMAGEFVQFLPHARGFLDFVNNSPTQFHAVATAKKYLVESGFQSISELDKWDVKPTGKYFFTRNQSTIVAFMIGGKYKPGNGFNLVGAHTDSPNLKIKPNHEVKKEGYHQIEIEPYGGGLWTTWFDRDLTVAGRVVVKKEATYESHLVCIDRPILRIPTLAIHLDRDSGNKLEFNKQTHLFPIISTIKSTLEQETPKGTVLTRLLAEGLKCDVEDIRDFELSVCDTQKSVLGGLFNEFIFSPRIDNLMMSFCGLTALIEASQDSKAIAEENNVLGLALFDNEEVGSDSAHGAASPIVSELVRRLTNSTELFEIAIRKSFLVSADMAHAVHPNYSDKHDPNHKPSIHKGVVIKLNANQRYATTSITSLVLKEIANRNNIPIQEFVVRNDSLCGSTIGPIVSSHTGIRTVDIGNPQLSMHSIRETCGIVDVTYAINLLRSYYLQFTALDAQLKVD